MAILGDTVAKKLKVMEGISGTPLSAIAVGGATEGNALINATPNGYGAIFNAPTKDYRISLATYPSSNNQLILYSFTNAKITAQTNTPDQTLTWDAGTGTLSTTALSTTTISNVNGITFANVAAGATRNLLYATVADNDFFRISAGGASNACSVEIATADDGNEPIYIRQYTGTFATVKRTATILDGSGNTSFPGSVTATGGFVGDLTGNASTATTATTANTVARATFGDASNAEHNANNIASNGLWYYTSNGPATTIGASTADGAIYSQAYSTSWVGQIAQDYRNGNLFVRGKNSGTWTDWKAIATKATTLAGYGITDAASDSNTVHKTGNETIAGTKTFSATISGSISGNAATATKLATARSLKTALNSTTAVTFDGSADQNSIPVTGTLGAGNGGTGQTSLINACNSLLNALSTGSSDPVDNDYYISQYVNGGATTTTYHRRPVSKLYNYIKSKTDSVYAAKATTLAGYNIGDAKIASGVITLGTDSITPLTANSTLNAAKLSGTIPAGCYTNTTYSAGTGLSLSGTTFNHSNSVTAGTAGTSAATSGATLAVPYVTYDAQGHVTASGTHTHTITGFSTTDTKNTAGSTDTSSKIFLVGATSQAANPQTYSDNEVYATNGVLTTKSVQVGGTACTLQYNSTNQCLDFVFA